jgi:hypothetical protein
MRVLTIAAAVPVDIDRDDARSAARRELTRAEYQADQPSLIERVARWVMDFLSGLLDRASGASPGGYAGLVVLLLLIVVAVVAIRLKVGPLARAGKAQESLFLGAALTAADHRRAAEGHAGAGRWDEALRERLRALIRDLEERGLLDPRPGRTADEAARDAGAALPSYAADLRAAAVAFDDVWYGGRPATRAAYHQVTVLDEALRRTRPSAQAKVMAGTGAAFAEPPQ